MLSLFFFRSENGETEEPRRILEVYRAGETLLPTFSRETAKRQSNLKLNSARREYNRDTADAADVAATTTSPDSQ